MKIRRLGVNVRETAFQPWENQLAFIYFREHGPIVYGKGKIMG